MLATVQVEGYYYCHRENSYLSEASQCSPATEFICSEQTRLSRLSTAVKINDTYVSIDPQILFTRLLLLKQKGMEDIQQCFKYELTPMLLEVIIINNNKLSV